jgi:hypothetical protein
MKWWPPEKFAVKFGSVVKNAFGRLENDEKKGPINK